MSEPLDPLTQWRLAQTQKRMALARMVDLPVVGKDVRVGTLAHRAIAAPKPAIPVGHFPCKRCGTVIKRLNGRHLYCTPCGEAHNKEYEILRAKRRWEATRATA